MAFIMRVCIAMDCQHVSTKKGGEKQACQDKNGISCISCLLLVLLSQTVEYRREHDTQYVGVCI